MGFLVGNDFIPHLPDLHISKGALPILYKVYTDVLPKVGGNCLLSNIKTMVGPIVQISSK